MSFVILSGMVLSHKIKAKAGRDDWSGQRLRDRARGPDDLVIVSACSNGPLIVTGEGRGLAGGGGGRGRRRRLSSHYKQLLMLMATCSCANSGRSKIKV